MKGGSKKKRKWIALLEYGAVYTIILAGRSVPLIAARIISNFLGDLLYFFVRRRRRIAIENIEHAFGRHKTGQEVRAIARRSCRSAINTFLEMIKFHDLFDRPDILDHLRKATANLDALFLKAKKIHDQAGGCIFVTPHFGNWEILPHVSSVVGIPLVVVARPLDNPYLEKLLFGSRAATGQMIIPKRNAFFALQKTLMQKKSIGMLPDQGTNRGISINFFGREARTTPVPAILAITYQRPIIVVACCRMPEHEKYEGFVSNPIWPGEFTSEKAEIFRLTQEIARQMEVVISKYPEQYLWIHNRWKRYEGTRQVLG